MNCSQMRSLVDGLVRLSFDDGQVSLSRDRTSAILRVLQEKYGNSLLKKILRLYLKRLIKAVFNCSMILESSESLPITTVSNLKSHFEKILKRKFRVTLKENPELIAGLRVTVQDHIVEYSINGTLESYRALL